MLLQVIDLTTVSQELAYLASDADLVILEGMVSLLQIDSLAPIPLEKALSCHLLFYFCINACLKPQYTFEENFHFLDAATAVIGGGCYLHCGMTS